jgi:hypothetical protein
MKHFPFRGAGILVFLVSLAIAASAYKPNDGDWVFGALGGTLGALFGISLWIMGLPRGNAAELWKMLGKCGVLLSACGFAGFTAVLKSSAAAKGSGELAMICFAVALLGFVAMCWGFRNAARRAEPLRASAA